METVLTVVHVLVSLFMILVVLMQGGNAGGIGAAFGGGNSQGFFGASGATSFLGKVTYACAGVFMATSIWLSVIQSDSGDIGLKEKLQQLDSSQQDGLKEPAPEKKDESK